MRKDKAEQGGGRGLLPIYSIYSIYSREAIEAGARKKTWPRASLRAATP